MPTKKMPGLIQDPWKNKMAETPEPVQAVAPRRAERQEPDDLEERKYATLELKSYGGITVEGAQETPIAAVRILDFCVKEQALLEPIFLKFGVVIAKFEVRRFSNLKFYIQRNDGWMLAIPEATTRDQGALQLIQALLEARGIPELQKKLDHAKIRPYKM